MEDHKMERKKCIWSIVLIMVSLIAVAGFIVAYAAV